MHPGPALPFACCLNLNGCRHCPDLNGYCLNGGRRPNSCRPNAHHLNAYCLKRRKSTKSQAWSAVLVTFENPMIASSGSPISIHVSDLPRSRPFA